MNIVSNSKNRIRTTLVATIGPASSSQKELKALLDAGMTVARFNLAHSKRADHEAAIKLLKDTLAREGRVCAVLVSLRGATLRTGGSPGAAVRRVSEGDVITLRCDDKAPDEPATVQNAALPAALAENDLLVIDDGQLVCRVLSADAKTGRVLTVANNSSSFGPGQRVVCHTARFDDAFWSQVEKTDVEDALWAASLGAELIDAPARSMAAVRKALEDTSIEFVERVEDRDSLEKQLASTGEEPRTAGTLLLRAQTGAYCGVAELVGAQRALTTHAIKLRRPLLVCAHMLGSMVKNPLPSRAESTDVYNAVIAGAHALVLTGETAVGRAPARAVKQLGNICAEAESVIDYRTEYVALRRDARPGSSLASSLASSAALVARDAEATSMLLVDPDPELSKDVAMFRGCTVVQIFDKSNEHAAARATLLRGRATIIVDKLAKVTNNDWTPYVSILLDAKYVQKGTKLVILSQQTVELHIV